MDPMKILEPNYLGDEDQNTGLDSLSNYGLGVENIPRDNPLLPQIAGPGKVPGASQHPAMEKLRASWAKQLGMKKEELGF